VSALWFWGVSVALNVVSAILYVLAVRAEKRIKQTRERLRLDRRQRFGDSPAGRPW
jgi:hypothetical protein